MHIRDMFLERIKHSLCDADLPLRVIFWDGAEFQFSRSPLVSIHLKSFGVLSKLLVGSAIDVLGEAYVEGDIDLEGRYQDILTVAEVLNDAFPSTKPRTTGFLRKALHSKTKDKEAIHYHYDVSNAFYQLWLDQNMIYSCGYFKTGTEDIDTAQEQKLDHICRKLRLQPGEKLLDIGCGWGGLLSWAARHYGIQGVGITLSKEQHAYAQARMDREGLTDSVEIRLQDYRDIPEREHFDKVSSIGMFEHVGRANLPEYFDMVQRVLKEGGWVMNHGITAASPEDEDGHHSGSDFIDKYVFPGGEIPHLWRVVRDMAGAHLEVLDVENLRPHYSQTLIHWVRRLVDHKEEAISLVGEKVYRIWTIYMAGCAYGFWHNWSALHQVLAVKQTHGKLTPRPWERRYQYDERDPFRLVEVDWGDL